MDKNIVLYRLLTTYNVMLSLLQKNDRNQSFLACKGLVAWLDRPYKQSYFSRRLSEAWPSRKK